MKKVKVIIGLLILLSVVYTIPIGSAGSASDVLHQDGIEFDQKHYRGDKVNTTNPYTDINSTPLDERYLAEGSRPLNVLIFADEEERGMVRTFYSWGERYVLDWEDYIVWQIERGDEALVAEFGIDIRVIGALTWDSDDSQNDLDDLIYEFWYENEHYLRNEYNGTEIDAIIGITAQGTIDSGGRAHIRHNVILLQWIAYWADDNLLQHEISHLFQADDHYEGWCIMANWTQLLLWIEEEGDVYILWGVYVPAAFRTHEYCSDCYNTINDHKDQYPIPLGDANFDGDVDMADYDIWVEHSGEYYPSWTFWVDGVDPDFDNNGIVNLDDLLIWQENAMGHDVAVTSVTASPTILGVGESVTINVNVENEGSFTETFDVTTYYDSTAISTQTVTNLAFGGSSTLTFTWNTLGVPDGTYTIKAVASTVPSETDTADNTYVDGTVRVKYPGDVDGDGDVDRYDSGTFSVAYGSQYGDPNYDWRCDFDGDGDVDRYDSGILARNYGHRP